MIASKHITRIVVVLTCLALVFCGFIVIAADMWERDNSPEYCEKLFGDDIITLEIEADESDWQNLLDNAQAKEWISGTLIINGERFSTVGIRTKGNSSLSSAGRGGADGTAR